MAKKIDNRKIVINLLLDSSKDSLKLFASLVNDFNNSNITEINEEDNIQLARMLSLGGIAIEKLLVAILYSQNPLFLVKDINDKKLLINFVTKGYDFFDKDWIYSTSNSFINPQVAWDQVNSIEGDSLAKFKIHFDYIKEIRNKYLHLFPKDLSWRSVLFIRVNSWLLIKKLLNILEKTHDFDPDEYFEECGLSSDAIEEIENYNDDSLEKMIWDLLPEITEALSKIVDIESKRKMLLRKLYKEDILKALTYFMRNGEEAVEWDEEGNVFREQVEQVELFLRDEINCNCPYCHKDDIEQTGYLYAEVESIDSHFNGDSDYETWNEPIDADIQFKHFYCTNCGMHSSEPIVLRSLKYYRDIMNFKLWFEYEEGKAPHSLYISSHGTGVKMSDY